MASESRVRNIDELILALSHLADRLAADRRPGLDSVTRASLRRIVCELERHIPGLEPPPDAKVAKLLASSSAAALFQERERDALILALRGLAHAPHGPELHYLAASACLELGAVREAVSLLNHTLWIHPGHPSARRDLETLTACRGVWEPWAWSWMGEADPAHASFTSSDLELFEEGERAEPLDPEGPFWGDGDAWPAGPLTDDELRGYDDDFPGDDDLEGDSRAA